MVGMLNLLPAEAQGTTVTTTTSTSTGPITTGSASDAVNIAKDGVDASIRDRVVSVYGTGTPAGIQTWWVIFYDPSVESHGRAVKVDNGQITRSYEAKGGVVYGDALTFPRSQVGGETAALQSAQDYAAKHAIAYDHVRALLRVTAQNQDLRWRVQLLDGATNKGFVFVSVSNGEFASYAPAGAVHTSSASSTGGVVGDAQHLGNDVKNTFLGIGGDLQEFFTGDRTVDQ